MTAKAALCKALLDGRTINVKNCFELIGLTNASREVGRMVEKDFDVRVSRTPRKGKSRYGQAVNWVDYRLMPTEENKEGIRAMKEYVNEQLGKYAPKTGKELKQMSLL